MNTVCTYLKLQDRLCTNGFKNDSQKIYTNIADDTVIQLKLGYSLKVTSTSFSTIDFIIYNNLFTAEFSQAVNTEMLYSLPCEGGCYLLHINYQKICMSNMCCESGG